MFDVGFTELILIGVVSLIVIGPERLPKVARTVGALLGRLQRYVSDVKSDINRELQLEELRKMQTEVEQSAREMELTLNKETRMLESDLNQAIAPAMMSSDSSSPDGKAAQTGNDGPASDQMELELAPGAAKKTGGAAG